MSTSRYRRSSRRPSMRRRGKVEDAASVVIDAIPDERGVPDVRRGRDGGRASRRGRLPLGEHRDGVWLPIGQVDETGIVRDGGNVARLVRDPSLARQSGGDSAAKLLAMENVE